MKHVASIDNESYISAKLDSGATNNYLKLKHRKLLKNYKLLKNGPSTILHNNEIVTSNESGIMELHKDLSSKAQEALIMPHLKTSRCYQ